MKTFAQVVKWHDRIALNQRGTIVGEEHREMWEALDTITSEHASEVKLLHVEVSDLKSKLVFMNAMAVDQSKTVATFEAEVAELTADVARYKVDAERLEWAESKFSDGVHIEGCFSGSYSAANLRPCASVFYGQNVAEATTIREAIDIARNALKEGV